MSIKLSLDCRSKSLSISLFRLIVEPSSSFELIISYSEGSFTGEKNVDPLVAEHGGTSAFIEHLSGSDSFSSVFVFIE